MTKAQKRAIEALKKKRKLGTEKPVLLKSGNVLIYDREGEPFEVLPSGRVVER